QADGLFDVTIGAVSTLWDFTEGVRPAPEAIADALPHVDWRCIEIDEEALTVRLTDPQAKLDLGGIAKGYVADRLCDLLRDETNATGAVLSLGGNIALFGEKPNGEPWETGVRDPNDPGGDTVVGTARVQGGSLVTSGLYERVFEQDGVTYWHILDPRTGEPSRPTWRASPCSACPRLPPTALDHAVRGRQPPRRGIADALEDTAAYFILQDGRTVESARWQELTDFSSQMGR
ncbi:MAG: FAD:protein FMN transferase, partial [Collinsella intestinalis]